MIILRLPPFPLEAKYEGLEPDTEYLVNISGPYSTPLYSEIILTDSAGTLTIVFNRLPEEDYDTWDFTRYDETYSVDVSKFLLGSYQQSVISDSLEIVRPYINPLIGATEQIIEDQKYEERLARFIIDSYTGGFYYTRKTYEAVGLGADFLPIPDRVNRIDRVSENNLLVFDSANPVNDHQRRYVISPDYSSITIALTGQFNYRESRPARVPLAYSDSFALFDDNNDSPPVSAFAYNNDSLFPNGNFYLIEGEFGWSYVPTDIQDATKLLMRDIHTNANAYTNKYISQYDTDQFTIKHDPSFVHGTGNRLVDQILSKYILPIYKLGVL